MRVLFLQLASLAFALMFLCCSTGCSADPTFRFAADTTPAERELARKGMARWYRDVNPEDRPIESTKGDWLITFTDDIPAKDGRPGTDFRGRTCTYNAKTCPHDYQILVRRTLPTPQDSVDVTAHEVGHALGLLHVDDEPVALMYGPTTAHPEIRRYLPISPVNTEADKRECRRAGRCPAVEVSRSVSSPVKKAPPVECSGE